MLGGEKHILRTDLIFARAPGSRPALSADQAEGLRLLRAAQAAEEGQNLAEAIELYKRAFRLDLSC